MEQAETVTERWAKLYGPHREVIKRHCKSICTKDSVREALVKGEYGENTEAIWLTSTKDSYQVVYKCC